MLEHVLLKRLDCFPQDEIGIHEYTDWQWTYFLHFVDIKDWLNRYNSTTEQTITNQIHLQCTDIQRERLHDNVTTVVFCYIWPQMFTNMCVDVCIQWLLRKLSLYIMYTQYCSNEFVVYNWLHCVTISSTSCTTTTSYTSRVAPTHDPLSVENIFYHNCY